MARQNSSAVFLSLIRRSDFILLGGLEMRSDLKTDYIQRDTERAGQTEKALYLLNTISAITDRGNKRRLQTVKGWLFDCI